MAGATNGGDRALGRGVVIGAGDAVAAPWRDAPVVTIGEAEVADPVATVGVLHDAWLRRRPVVVALAVDPNDFRAPRADDREPWQVGACFELPHERLHFLVWANSYDARGGKAPVWWWARRAARLGALEVVDGPGDVILPDGRRAWIDGGPRGPLPLDVATGGTSGETRGGAAGDTNDDNPSAGTSGDTSDGDTSDGDTSGDPSGGAAGGAAGDPSGDVVVVVHRETVELGRLDPVPPRVAVRADLAPDQLAAVAHGAGPARIIAPAGSGKTRVLTERLRHLIVDRGVERELVLAVAYNKKAQLEMESRTTDFRPRVSTLNALGLRLLAGERGRGPRVLDERDVRGIVESLVPRQRRLLNTDPLAPYLEGLSAIRLGLRDPDDVEDERDDVPGLAAAFAPFRARLRDAGAVDFDEMIYAAIEMLLRDGEARRRAQARCRHLLVDELQDLTPAHVLLLRLLASPQLDVFGVGDDDQVIYGHAGADPAFLIDFATLFPGAADHPLQVNYRCPVTVVDAARTLLTYNHRRVTKVIDAGPDAAPEPDALTIRSHPAEEGARVLVGVVEGWLAEGKAASEIAVLTRVNAALLPPHVALLEAGVPVASTLPRDVLDRTGVRAALAYLRLGADPGRMQPKDLAEVYRRPSRGFPQWIVRWFGRVMSIDDVRAIADKLDDDKVVPKVLAFADDLDAVARAVQRGTTRSALRVVAEEVGLGRAMSLLDGSKGGQSGSQLDDLDALVQVADLHPEAATFESWLRGVLARRPTATIDDDGSSSSGVDGVTLATIHRVKGMEWDRVVVAGVTGGVMPHRLASNVEEERRVLHVGITRGRERVVVLGDASRPSPFLDELRGTAPHRRAPAADVSAGGRSSAPSAVATTAKPAKQPKPVSTDAAAEAALRAWRLERCRADGVPAYVVFPDKVLVAIADLRPATLAELATVSGVGPTKLELYGDDVLFLLESLPAPG